ncbi:MAG TPA: RtcB family protein, partial [Thermoanaerobaculia bacterium]|nr:RtcB family protein [Thermoanaerobaculia bacterium]
MKLQRIDDTRWRIPREGKMRVEGIVYASDAMMEALRNDPALQQVANVAHLPGILRASLAMPDIHWGYGFPIGGVAATDADEGVISPGGVGYDINCGVRLLRTDLRRGDFDRRALREVVEQLYRSIPTGVGGGRRDLRLSGDDLDGVLRDGAAWAVDRGLGFKRDLAVLEEGGSLPQAEASQVSPRARERGGSQLGTLGSGNHFAEVQRVAEIYDERVARAFGLVRGQVTVMIHSGSRGLGHQVCTDHLKGMLAAAERHGIELPDRQLACAPLSSPEGKRYLAAMAAAANFAFANRQVMTHFVRESFAKATGTPVERLGIEVVYDVCHNIAKMETFEVDGRRQRACVHRKGATRAYPPGHAEVPHAYREVGQPVLIPGDMGRYSYVLAGTQKAYEETFGSSCHGAGRLLSRGEAKRRARGRRVVEELAEKGIVVMAAGMATVAEEMPEAYKDVADVVDVVTRAGIATKVARLA